MPFLPPNQQRQSTEGINKYVATLPGEISMLKNRHAQKVCPNCSKPLFSGYFTYLASSAYFKTKL